MPIIKQTLLLFVFFSVYSSMVFSVPAENKTCFDIDIPAMNAAKAINSLAEQTGAKLLFPYDLVRAYQTQSVRGCYTLDQALNAMLKKTGLVSSLSEKGLLIISTGESQTLNGINNQGKGEMNSRKKLLAATIGFFVGGGVSVVEAQDNVSANESSVWLLEEVVVTAEKREASMQDVPISITAFSGERLALSGIDDSLDLEMATPGLSMSRNSASGFVTIRGVGSPTAQGPASDPSSAVYIDGVYMPRNSSSLVDLMDIERIEVLKGPQGILYGRNSTGGAINYISNDPGRELGADIKVQIGNYDLQKVQASADIPLVEDQLFMRASVMNIARDGYTENLLNPSNTIDDEDLWAARVSFKYIFSENLGVTLHAGKVEQDGAIQAGIKHTIDPEGPHSEAEIIEDPRKVLADQPQEQPMDQSIVDLKVEWDIEWAMLTSITGYQEQTTGPASRDDDATELPLFGQGQPGVRNGITNESESFSQEFILSSTSEGQLSWLLGFYYFEEKARSFTGYHLEGFACCQAFGQFDVTNNTEAYATFGNASYDLSDKLRFNVGLRYSYEEKKLDFIHYTDFVVDTGPRKQSDDWSKWTPKIGLDYFVSDEVMVYFSASQGFKSGAFDSFSLSEAPSVDEETIDAFELGLKSTLLDGRLRVNASLFDYDFSDMQVQAVNPNNFGTTQLSNAGEADIRGAELESSILLAEGLQLDVGLSWLDTEFVEFVKPNGVDLSGNKLPNSPEFTANIGVGYDREVDGVGRLFSRVDYYYSDEKFFTDFNDAAKQESYELINMRLGIEFIGGQWGVALFGKNVTDELVRETVFVSPFLLGANGRLDAYAPPRTYGVEVSYSF